MGMLLKLTLTETLYLYITIVLGQRGSCRHSVMVNLKIVVVEKFNRNGAEKSTLTFMIWAVYLAKQSLFVANVF